MVVLRRLDGNGREKHQGDPGLTVLWSPYLSLLLTRGGGLVVSLAIDLAVEFSKTSQLADAFCPSYLLQGVQKQSKRRARVLSVRGRLTDMRRV